VVKVFWADVGIKLVKQTKTTITNLEIHVFI